MSGLHYRSASHSHVGMVRPTNQDACLDAPQDGLWVVADGMGGHAGGEFVSTLIVETLRAVPAAAVLADYLRALRAALEQAHALVRRETERRGVELMGSTLVLLAARGAEAACLWAGDSRLYRLRDGQLERLSHDHSYVQELVDGGLLDEAQARSHPLGNIVTRALGSTESLELAALSLEVRAGDCFLLCSDGLTRTVEDHELGLMLGHALPGEMVRSLIHLGLLRGAPDNLTVVVVRALADDGQA